MGVVERVLAATSAKVPAKTDPNDPLALLRQADGLAKAGDAAMACETYARAGDIFVIQGFARRALAAFTQALDVAKKASLLERVVPIARAMAKLSMKEKLTRDATDTLDQAARFLIERGADAGAQALLEERIAVEDSDVARVRLAEGFFRLGEKAKAAEHLTCVFRRLYADSRHDEALDVAERLLGEARNVAIARLAAQLYLTRNRPGDAFLALSKLRICCDADPAHVPTLQLLARAFDQAGHAEKATRVRREIALVSAPAPLPRLEAKSIPRSAPKLEVDDGSIDVDVDAGWDDLLEAKDRIDPSRASFWAVEEGPAADESGSVVSVSLADVELIDGAPQSGERRTDGASARSEARSTPEVSMLETALECVESLVAQGRYEEASLLVARNLTIRPRNPLLLERKAEIDEMQNAHKQGPPPALFAMAPRRADSQRSVQTVMKAG